MSRRLMNDSLQGALFLARPRKVSLLCDNETFFVLDDSCWCASCTFMNCRICIEELYFG